MYSMVAYLANYDRVAIGKDAIPDTVTVCDMQYWSYHPAKYHVISRDFAEHFLVEMPVKLIFIR